MTGNEYQKACMRTLLGMNLGRCDMEWHSLHGLASEVGELHGIFQKFYQGHPVSEEHMKREVGDILCFAMEFCFARGWTAEEVMQANIDKLQARYPNGFETEKSLYRQEGDT